MIEALTQVAALLILEQRAGVAHRARLAARRQRRQVPPPGRARRSAAPRGHARRARGPAGQGRRRWPTSTASRWPRPSCCSPSSRARRTIDPTRARASRARRSAPAPSIGPIAVDRPGRADRPRLPDRRVGGHRRLRPTIGDEHRDLPDGVDRPAAAGSQVSAASDTRLDDRPAATSSASSSPSTAAPPAAAARRRSATTTCSWPTCTSRTTATSATTRSSDRTRRSAATSAVEDFANISAGLGACTSSAASAGTRSSAAIRWSRRTRCRSRRTVGSRAGAHLRRQHHRPDRAAASPTDTIGQLKRAYRYLLAVEAEHHAGARRRSSRTRRWRAPEVALPRRLHPHRRSAASSCAAAGAPRRGRLVADERSP